MATKRATRQLTDAQIDTILRGNNPLIHGRLERLQDQREHMAIRNASEWEMAQIDAEIAEAEAAVVWYEAHMDGLVPA